MVSLFFSQHNGVVSSSPLLIVFDFFLFSPWSWVWYLIRIAAYIRNTLLSNHIAAIYPPHKPASGLVLCSRDDAVDDDQSWSGTAPISPLLADGGPPVKNCPGSLYYGATLIAPEGRNTRRIWRPPCCCHQRSGCRPCPDHLVTDSYP